MLAGIDAGLEMDRAKVWGGSQKHDVNTAIDELLVGVKADKTVFGIDGDTILELPFQATQRVLQAVAEGVGQGHQSRVGIGPKGIGRRAAAASAAADQADPQHVAAGGMRTAAQRQASPRPLLRR